ncbi:hypothetical protein ACIP39_11950 [Streptomyces tibetensis]|uniref:hypothetical protein n=1 Tax=Streptomyces tibetensis TaxID=2382123 RepID=UPI00380E1E24
MSDSAIIIAELTASVEEAPERAAAATNWLLDQRIIQPNDRPDPLWRPSRYIPGSAATAAVRDTHDSNGPVGDGIDILDQRQVHDPGGNYTPPTCPNCTTQLDEDAHITLVQHLLDQTEPFATCENCATSALLGDWTGQWTIHVASVAVRFNNWPPLGDAFLLGLSDHLGPRCRLIQKRI